MSALGGNDLSLKVGFDIDKFQTELNKTTGALNKWASGVQSSLMGVAAGFSALAIGQFVLDVSKLAGEAEGVREAFDKLPFSVRLMHELKEATHGTVSELDLMKRAVMASNFGISLEALPQLLEFASVRAKQTGQSVDYLVDSIVTGIGRKSKLILDNLGISAVQLTEALGGASTAAASIGDVADAVGKIAEDNLKQMGKMSENASTKLERLSAEWVNFKVAIGDAANGTGVLGQATDGLNQQLSNLSSKHLDFWDKISSLTSPMGAMAATLKAAALGAKELADEEKKMGQVMREVDRAMASTNPDEYINAMKMHVYYTEILTEYTKRLKNEEEKRANSIENIANLTAKLTELQGSQLTQTGKALIKTNQEIELIEKKIKALKELGILEDDSDTKRLARLAKYDRQMFPKKNAFEKVSFGVDEDLISRTADSWKEAGERMKQTFDSLKEKNDEVAESIRKRWVEISESINSAIQTGMVDVLSSLGEELGNVFDGNSDNIGASLLGAIGRMASQLGQLAIGIGVTMLNIKQAFKPPFNAAGAIAAGVALVALGKVFSNQASRIGSASSGGGGGSSGGGGGGERRVDNLRVQPIQINIGGTAMLKASGPDLIATFNKEMFKQTRR